MLLAKDQYLNNDCVSSGNIIANQKLKMAETHQLVQRNQDIPDCPVGLGKCFADLKLSTQFL